MTSSSAYQDRIARASLPWLLGALLLGAPALGAPAATEGTTPRDASELLAAFAKLPGIEARFEEEKHISLLAAPLKSAGRIYFCPPGYFARHVEEPKPSTVVITPSALRLGDARGERTIDLDARPDVGRFISSFVSILAGDHARLQALYHLRFEHVDAPAGTWRMTLTPRAAPLTDLIGSMEVHGAGFRITRIRVNERSGDWSLFQISDAKPDRRFTDAEFRRLFGARDR